MSWDRLKREFDVGQSTEHADDEWLREYLGRGSIDERSLPITEEWLILFGCRKEAPSEFSYRDIMIRETADCTWHCWLKGNGAVYLGDRIQTRGDFLNLVKGLKLK